MSQTIDDMILAILESGDALLSEVIRDRIYERFNQRFYQSYVTKRLSFLIQQGKILSDYAVRDGKKTNYSEYRLNRIAALLSDPAEKRVGAQKTDEPAKEVVVREWRQANSACPGCGGWYQIKKGEKWVCSRC